jgi:hypothetical protein
MTAEISKFESAKIKQKNKCIELLKCLNTNDEIDLNQLRLLSFTGIPTTCPGLKAIVWRLLLGHFSLNASDWQKSLEGNL